MQRDLAKEMETLALWESERRSTISISVLGVSLFANEMFAVFGDLLSEGNSAL